MKATAKEMRFKTKEILAAIERGEEVTITYRGKEKARILPILQEQPTSKDKPAFHKIPKQVYNLTDFPSLLPCIHYEPIPFYPCLFFSLGPCRANI
jgi:prevent-host-death family protein